MTLPPLTDAITFWTIEIVHDDFFNGWSIKDSEEAYVSAKGYATVRAPATFRSESDASKFLSLNQKVLDRRCGEKQGFFHFRIVAIRQFWPVAFDEVVQLVTKRKRTAASRNTS